MKLSQASLDKFDNCPRSFQFSIESPVYYGGSVRAVGTAVHAAHELFYGRKARPPWPVTGHHLDELIETADYAFDNEVNQAGGAFVWDEDIPDWEEAYRRIEAMLAHYYTQPGPDGSPIPWPEEFEVLGTEVPWELPLSDEVTITSRGIDLVLRDPVGFVIGVDHKTTKGNKWDQFKHHPRKKAQGPLYVWAMRQLWPGAPGYRFAYDIITPPGKRATTLPRFERRMADPTDDQINAALARVGAAAFMFERYRSNGMDLPAVPSSTLCSARYCDYFSICPFGAALDTPLPE